MAQLKSTKVFGDLNVTGEVNASTKITVNGEEVWDTGNLLNIGTTAITARTALGLGAGATRWPTFAEVTGKPATYAPSGHTHPVSQVTGLDAALADKADKTTQVIAGTGLSGGGTLAANRTLTVSYGTTAGTAAQGNDSRLSNSREWTAAVVTQAEAEAGTATTERKWTAQRVAQAISALGLKIGTTATTAKAGNWMPTYAEVTGKPTNYATTWNSVAAKPAQATRWPTWSEVEGKPVQQGLGNSSTNIMSQKAITDAIGVVRGLSLGEGQTWQDMTSSRERDVTYTNTTGRTIVVMLNTGNNNRFFFVNEVSFALWDETGTATFIIPSGTTYSTSNNFHTFMELR